MFSENNEHLQANQSQIFILKMALLHNLLTFLFIAFYYFFFLFIYFLFKTHIYCASWVMSFRPPVTGDRRHSQQKQLCNSSPYLCYCVSVYSMNPSTRVTFIKRHTTKMCLQSRRTRVKMLHKMASKCHCGFCMIWRLQCGLRLLLADSSWYWFSICWSVTADPPAPSPPATHKCA